MLVGSSHGAYIADICAKIAPWMIDAVIDNSSWNLPISVFKDKNWKNGAFRTIGFGKELANSGLHRHHERQENFFMCLSNTTKWTSDENSPNYFSLSRYEVRDVNFKEHLKTQAKYKKAVYVFYHSKEDSVAPVDEKIAFYESLKELGFDAILHVIKDEKEVDDKFIKNLSHGMGMSIKTLILKELPRILEFSFSDFKGKKEISYLTDEWEYNFKQIDDKLVLSCEKI